MKTKKLLLASASLTIFSLSIILFQISCKKDATAQNSTSNCIGPQPTLQFKGNGVLYTCNAVADSRLGWVGYPRIIGQKNGDSTYGIEFCNKKQWEENGTWMFDFPITPNLAEGGIDWKINGSVLTQGIYSNKGMALGLNYQNSNYHYETNPNCFTVNINSISNRMATGTFSGSLPSGNGSINNGPAMMITDGVFSNLPILE